MIVLFPNEEHAILITSNPPLAMRPLTIKYKRSVSIMTSTTTNLTVTQGLSLSVEDMQAMTLAQLAELHSIMKESKQKKAGKRADLIAGIITAKKKEAKKAEPEKVAVENSAKVKAKPAKKVAKPKASAKPAKTEEKAEEPKAEAKQEEAPKQKSLDSMTKEELLAFISSMETKQDVFPEIIEATKMKYVKTSFDNVKEIQNQLKSSPYSLYLFMDERLKDENLTQFLVLFANAEVVVLLDRNRQKNTTITLATKDFKDGSVVVGDGKFDISYYISQKK
jgi:hypothetical protein